MPRPIVFALQFVLGFALCHFISLVEPVNILSALHVKLLALLGLSGISLGF